MPMTEDDFVQQVTQIANTFSQDNSRPVIAFTTGGPTGFLGASAFYGCQEAEIWQFLWAMRSMEQSARTAFLNNSTEEPQEALARLGAE